MTEKERVAEHLNTLSILYYVWSGFHLLGMCAGGVYIALGGFFAAAIKSEPKAPEEAQWFGAFFAVIGAFVLLIALMGAVCSFLSARWLKQRQHRTFSMVYAVFACLSIPLGSALGVFTLVILQKAEALELYGEAGGGAPAHGEPPPI